jgi:hypothetical protein
MASITEIKGEVLGKQGPYTILNDNLQAKQRRMLVEREDLPAT